MSELDALARRVRAEPDNSELWFRWHALARRQGWSHQGRSLEEWCRRLICGKAEERRQAEDALADLGPRLIPALEAHLDDKKARQRKRAMRAILARGGGSYLAPRLFAMSFDDPSENLRRSASLAFSQVEALPDLLLRAVLPPLVSGKAGPEFHARHLLQDLGPRAAPLVPELRALFFSTTGETRRFLTGFLPSFLDGARGYELLLESLADKDSAGRAAHELRSAPIPEGADPAPVIAWAVSKRARNPWLSAEILRRFGDAAVSRAIAVARERRRIKLLVAFMTTEPAALGALIELTNAGFHEQVAKAARCIGAQQRWDFRARVSRGGPP